MRSLLEARVEKTIREHRLIDSATQRIYIAISGGADSVTLLMAMLALGYGKRIEALHCNFALRGEESDQDEEFVQALCAKHSIPLHVKHFDTRSYSEENRISIEMAARELRYRWFQSFTTGSDGTRVVAVAHNADDQIETLLLNLSMGTGIRGLSGMPFQKATEGIIRPLQETPRSLILDYLHSLGQSYREDSSNSDTRYKRNLIRHRLIPLFEDLNPSFREAANRTIEHLSSTEALYLESIEHYRTTLLSSEGLNYKPLLNHPELASILFELLRPYGFQRSVIAALSKHLKQGTAGARFYSTDYLLIQGFDLLELFPREEAPPPSYLIDIRHDGSLSLPFGGVLRWEHLPLSDLNGGYRFPREVALFDYDLLKSDNLTIRSRQEGDALHPFGMSGKKLLRRILIDGKFSHRTRREALLLCKGDYPIWFIGYVADRTYALTSSTKRVLRFTVSPEE
ncbi:tRNA lysidine(34) synthetase TilS [Porphyromonas sp.]